MNRNPLLPCVLTAAICFTGVNVIIDAWTHRLPYRKKLEAIRTASDPNLLFIGNSLMDGHLDEPLLAAHAATHGVVFLPLNAALGASQPFEQRLLFEYASELHPSIRTVVVGIFDFQLTEEGHDKALDLTGNRMVGLDRRFPVSQVAAVYGFGSVDRFEVALLQHLPMIANRANVWKYVELLRRSMGKMGMPHVATNGMGRVDDFDALEAASSRDFAKVADPFLRQPDHFNSSFESVFDQAHRAGMDAVILLMPMSPYHQSHFYSQSVWSQYRVALLELAQKRRIRVIDASDWMKSEGDFEDHLHMSLPGVHEFTLRLGDELTVVDLRQAPIESPRIGAPAH